MFQAFDLPQDFSSYVNRFHDEVADRCLTRGCQVGCCMWFSLIFVLDIKEFILIVIPLLFQFLADFAHIIKEYP